MASRADQFAIHPGVVFDCNVFLQAVAKGGNRAYGCLQLVTDGEVTLYMSDDCLAEIDEVLRRPELRAIFPMLTDERVDALIELMRDVAVFLDPVPHIFDYPPDVTDEPYIDLAIAAGAVFLVSWDKHIRNLGNPDHADGRRLQEGHPGVAIMDPGEFLREYYKAG